MELYLLQEKQYKDLVSDKLFEISELRNKKDRLCIAKCDALYEEAMSKNDVHLIGELLVEKAVICYQMLNEYKQSLSFALQAYHLCEEHKDLLLTKINAASAIGLTYYFLGDLSASKNYYTDAIEMLESISQPNHHVKRLIANNYFNLTNLYKEIEHNDTRLGYLNKAKQLFLEINNKLGYARVLNSYSIFHPDYKNTELGLQNYIEAEQIFLELGDQRGRAVILTNMGLYYATHNQIERGLDCMNTAVALLEEIGQAKFLINAYLMRGIAYSNANLLEESIADFKKCNQMIIDSDSTAEQHTLFYEWSYVLRKQGNFEEALNLLHNYLIVKNELDQFDKKSALSEEKIAFQLQEKEREAQLLRRKNEEIQAYAHRLEMSNSDLKRFAHIASHDMREPLRMVNLYVQKLENSMHGNVESNQKEYFDYIKLGAKRMYSLIDSVLNLNNIDPVINKELVSINEVIEEVKMQLDVSIKERNVQIAFGQLNVVMADKNLLVQLFQNLISNAIKYNKSEVIEINISSQIIENYNEIRIADNGIGIEADFREKVFEIFQRLNNKQEFEGTGIGLTIVKKIMDAYRGSIHIEDNLPQGSVFVLRFPF